jgi:glycosyltransferase involved in cell wall biosynthesis
MKRPTIDLHIHELILRNVPYAQRHHIAAAVEQELTRLLTEQGVPPTLANGGTIPEITIDNISVVPDAKPDAIGNAIAQNIYGNLGNASDKGEM